MVVRSGLAGEFDAIDELTTAARVATPVDMETAQRLLPYIERLRKHRDLAGIIDHGVDVVVRDDCIVLQALAMYRDAVQRALQDLQLTDTVDVEYGGTKPR